MGPCATSLYGINRKSDDYEGGLIKFWLLIQRLGLNYTKMQNVN